MVRTRASKTILTYDFVYNNSREREIVPAKKLLNCLRKTNSAVTQPQDNKRAITQSH